MRVPVELSLGGLALKTRSPNLIGLVVVLVGVVDGEAGEIVGHFEDVLIALVPWRGGFVDHHHPLLGEAQLDKTCLADVGAEPAGIFQLFITGKFRHAQTLDHGIEFVTFQPP